MQDDKPGTHWVEYTVRTAAAAADDSIPVWRDSAAKNVNISSRGQLFYITEIAPRVPRSMTRDSVPVWRDRWNARSWLCRCSKVVLATRRIVFCVTCEM